MNFLKVLRRARLIGLLTLLAVTSLVGQDRGSQDPRQAERGRYFEKKSYSPAPLPTFAETQARLPSPVYDENPLFLKLYWKAWEISFKNFHEPAPKSGFVSQFIDAAFNDNIFLWDTAFMTMFCNVASPLVPGIGSLDNFYAKQHPTGEICREIQRKSGLDFSHWVNSGDTTLFTRWGWDFPPARQLQVQYVGRATPKPNPRLTLDAMNHPILAWAELESYYVTGDSVRLRIVWEPLVRYYRAFQKYLLQGNGLYITDWASMDNSPRNADLLDGGTGVDISSEMVLFARHLSMIARILGKNSESKFFAREADDLSRRINKLMWNPGQGFYYDLTIEGMQSPVKTVAGYWTLLAHVASPAQARLLVDHLKNPATFGRVHPVPTCAADEPGYLSDGGYWRGAVWAPTNTMVIRGLENYGYDAMARSIAIKHLEIMARVFEQTGTIWENYAPDSENPGRNTDSSLVNRDFVGWSGIGPVLYLLEYGVGLKPDAPANKLTWRIHSPQRVGCERYRFNGHVATLLAQPAGPGSVAISVNSDGPFTLFVEHHGVRRTFAVLNGANSFVLP